MTEGDRTARDRLFVYGTLRRTGSAAHVLASVGASFISAGRVAGRMLDLGRYPGLVSDDAAGSWVRGELYHLPDPGAVLPTLDAYEGGGFERAACGVELEDGMRTEAWAYFYRGDVGGASEIPAGDWAR